MNSMVPLEEKKELILKMLEGKKASKSKIAGILTLNYYRLEVLLYTMEHEGLIKRLEEEGNIYWTKC